jgi:cardiolipin synthase
MTLIVPISFPLAMHIVVATVLGLRILYRRLPVNTALAWIVLLIGMPVAGPVLYVLFGAPTLGQRRLRLGQQIRRLYQRGDASTPAVAIAPPFGALARAIAQDSGFAVTTGSRHTLFDDAGAILDAMVRDIDTAGHECCAEFYIIDPAGRVALVLQALERAAQRGLSVRVLADDFGSKAFWRSPWPDRLRRAGAQVMRSLPVSLIRSLSKRSDLRNHRKVLICDRSAAWLGSFNLIDPHEFKQASHVGEWIDVMLRIAGPPVDALALVFNTDWLFDRDQGAFDRAAITARTAAPAGSDGPMQLLPSGPEMPHSTIYQVIVAAIFNARQQVRIVTPYFIPDGAVMLALTMAARSGVVVELIVPARIDTRMARYASQACYDDLLDAGVIVRRFTGGLLHAKVMRIDDAFTLFGTVNMDMRSFYLNLELSLISYDSTFAAELDGVIDGYAARSSAIDAAQWRQRPARDRLLENVLRLAGPLL